MSSSRLFSGLAAIVLFFVLSACAGEPYVYRADEFNRAASTFKVEPKDSSAVIICYSSRNTTPERVRALAEQECARFGKKARISEQRFGECPLGTPATATFQCTGGRTYGYDLGGSSAPSIGIGGGGAATRTIDWSLPGWFYGPAAQPLTQPSTQPSGNR